jgi:hypothetical protein
MKQLSLILILLLPLIELVNGQNFIDQIITKSSDTIFCKITLINDQNIFCMQQKRKTQQHAYVSLNDIISYNWRTENSEDKSNFVKISFPYDSTSKWRTGLIAVQQINYPISHSILAFRLSKMNHGIHLGLNYTYIFKNHFGDESVNSYKNNSPGVNVGYRYIIDSKWERTNLFLQLDFSIYKVEYKEYRGHGSGVVDVSNLIIENNGSIGLNYKISEKIDVFGGVGIGSTAYFFLMIEQFIPHSYVGIEYKIK